MLGRLQALEHQAVHFEHVPDVSSILPVPGDCCGMYRMPGIDQPLDRLGDLEFTAPGGLQMPHGLMDGWGEHVHAHEAQVALRVHRLLHQADDWSAAVKLCNAERP